MLYPDRATVCVQQPGRVRDGLRLLRHRPGRLHPPPHRRARSSSRSCARARQARDGRAGASATSCSWAWASRSPTRPRSGPRSSASTATSGCRRATSRSRTVGIVPGIRRLAERPLPVNLAVSLHAANDELRDELVPINRRYPTRRADRRVRRLPRTSKGRRISFEWAMIDGVNDRDRTPRAGRAVLAGCARRARQPDPAQPDARLADDGHAAGTRRASSATSCARSASTRRCAATAAPTSTPRAASSPPDTGHVGRPVDTGRTPYGTAGSSRRSRHRGRLSSPRRARTGTG